VSNRQAALTHSFITNKDKLRQKKQATNGFRVGADSILSLPAVHMSAGSYFHSKQGI
jgi:hypothetical protein